MDILFPLGRLVAGSISAARTTDAEGKPRVYTEGPNVGKPRISYDFGLAIPKTAGHTHWAQTEWGRKIWDEGAQKHPNTCQSPTFSWKITDGDSVVPNSTGRKPIDQEGYAGNWVLWFSSGHPVKCVCNSGTTAMDPAQVKLGHWVEVFGNVAGNTGRKPGVYLNHSALNWVAYGEEITKGPDPTAMGFGATTALPAGASATPLASGFKPPAVPSAVAAPPVAPGASTAPVMPPATPTAVTPHPGILPVAGAAPAVPPGAPARPPAAPPMPPAGPQLTPKGAATGFTYAQYIEQGWKDDQLRAEGLLA
jgi:hypothetical protein